jgi:uncharacterized protein (TIGR02118 family)
MIRISVLYPNAPGKKFDLDYYAKTHMALVRKRIGGMGLLRIEVDKGLAGGTPESPAPFVCVGHLYFNSVAEFQKAMQAHGKELVDDVPKFTDIQPQFQISEILA